MVINGHPVRVGYDPVNCSTTFPRHLMESNVQHEIMKTDAEHHWLNQLSITG